MRINLYTPLFKCILLVTEKIVILAIFLIIYGCAMDSNVTHLFNTKDANVLPRNVAIEYIDVHVAANEQGIRLKPDNKYYPFEYIKVRINKIGSEDWYYITIKGRKESLSESYDGYENILISSANAREITRKLFVALISLGATPDY